MTVSIQSLHVGGRERGYLLVEPSGPATALILSLHGTRSSADSQLRLSRFVQRGPAVGAVVAFPQAILPIGRGYEWDHHGDMDYLGHLITELLERHPTAADRVVLAGMSGGARMACYFASWRPEQISLVGAVGGVRLPSAAHLARPVPIVAFHGTADRINPYPGSGNARWDESVEAAVHGWAAVNGVDGAPEVTQVTRHVTRTRYGAWAAGETTLWTVRGGGHTWPGSPLGPILRLFLGKTTTEIDATAEILAATHLTAEAG
jgi:polyhydroxybutyrate depolymerase